MEENKENTSVEPVVEQVPAEEPAVITDPVAEQTTEQPLEPVNTVSVEENKSKKKGPIILIIMLLLLIIGGVVSIIIFKPFDKKNKEKTVVDTPKEVKSDYRMSGNNLSAFDLYFLKIENNEKNLIYSPLSIKYALEMLAEGAKGETRAQLDAIIGDYKAKKYINNENMSFANAMFIRNSFKESVTNTYLNTLKTKYGAEVVYDSFESVNTINKWVSDKTFNLIKDLVDDVSDNDFILVNALGIDMKWKNQLHCAIGSTGDVPCYPESGIYSAHYVHEKLQGEENEYDRVEYPYGYEGEFPPVTFNGKANKKTAGISASFNRYDAVKEIGEAKIKEDVTKAYQEWLKSDEVRDIKNSGGSVEENINNVLTEYIQELKSNYGKEAASTDFAFYADDSVKVFTKDLQTTNGTTLQYVGIMPTAKPLKEFIHNSTAKTIQELINSTKELKIENFAPGYVTIIEGKIPLFKYDYELDLLEDLKKLGVTDVFNIEKANLGNMLTSESGVYINEAKHKANIEFSNEGIKAAAASYGGGAGDVGPGFNYLYEVPTIRIDLTFDKPYLYLIKDKNTDEVWFVGTVYEPITREYDY